MLMCFLQCLCNDKKVCITKQAESIRKFLEDLNKKTRLTLQTEVK